MKKNYKREGEVTYINRPRMPSELEYKNGYYARIGIEVEKNTPDLATKNSMIAALKSMYPYTEKELCILEKELSHK